MAHRPMNRNRLPISNDYPADWDLIGDRVRAEVNHRCVRCHHRYKTGEHGSGEWSPCDAQCRHHGPLGILVGTSIDPIPNPDMGARFAVALMEGKEGIICAQWRVLTVHHLDGNKANCEWWNLLPLCQRCHLQIQSRVNPEVQYFLEHSDWFKPYVAGFYAKKYEGKMITLEEALARMDELLAYERLA